MRCTKCGLREATTEVLKQHNDRIERMYLCDECASGVDIGFGNFGLADFITGSPMSLVSGGLFGAPTARDAVCPECKTKASEFIKTGFVGCPKCYSVFEPLVVQTVRKLQQSDRHVGKNPSSTSKVNETTARAKLEEDLRAAYESRDYSKIIECSARLSDLGIKDNGGERNG